MIKKYISVYDLITKIKEGTQPSELYVKNSNDKITALKWSNIAQAYMTHEYNYIQVTISVDTLFTPNSLFYYEEVLDEIETAYLRNLIAPFRSKVKYICKCGTENKNKYAIDIFYRDKDHTYDSYITLPPFERSSGMYKGMKVGRTYTVEELGL